MDAVKNPCICGSDAGDEFHCPDCGWEVGPDEGDERFSLRDIGTCQTCGAYGWLGDKCVARGACREFGSLYC